MAQTRFFSARPQGRAGFPSIDAVVARTRPSDPLLCLRPAVIAGAARRFVVRLRRRPRFLSGGSCLGLAQLPVPGQQLVQVGGRMIGNAAQYVGKPGLRIDAVEFCCSNEGVYRGSALTASVGAGEQPCAAPKSNATQSALGGVV